MFINLQSFDNLEDYDTLNDPAPSMEKLLTVALSHGLGGLCFAVEFYFDEEELGHFVNVQRRSPEEWDFETDRPVYPRYRPEDWEIKDFQHYRAAPGHEHGGSDFWGKGTIRRIIGRAEMKQKDSVFGAKYDGVWGKGPPVPGSQRPPPTFKWKAEREAWEFEIQHHGEHMDIL